MLTLLEIIAEVCLYWVLIYKTLSLPLKSRHYYEHTFYGKFIWICFRSSFVVLKLIADVIVTVCKEVEGVVTVLHS